MRRLIGALAVFGIVMGSLAATAPAYADYVRVDIIDPSNGDAWVYNGGNVPFIQTSDSNADSDFSEVGCMMLGGHKWCKLQAIDGSCVNVPTTGQYPNQGVDSSCQPGDFTPEMFYRFAGNDWENQHTGGDMIPLGDVITFSSQCGIPFPPTYCSNMYFDPQDTYLFNVKSS